MTEGGYQPTKDLEDSLPPEKGPNAFRTISEVADELHVPQHVLRFWETRFEQVRPLKRAGGRRYYRPTDIDLLRCIADLLYEKNYTVKGVQKILAEKTHQNSVAVHVVPQSEEQSADSLADGPVQVAQPVQDTPVVAVEHIEESIEPQHYSEVELVAPVVADHAEELVGEETSDVVQDDCAPAFEVPSEVVLVPQSRVGAAEQPTGYEFMQLGHGVNQAVRITGPEIDAWQRLAAETDQAVRVDEVISVSENMIVKAPAPVVEMVPSAQPEAGRIRLTYRLRHDLQDILVELEALRARLSA